MGAFGKDLFSIGKPAGYWIIPFAMYAHQTWVLHSGDFDNANFLFADSLVFSHLSLFGLFGK
jgi:hypothetical protein